MRDLALGPRHEGAGGGLHRVLARVRTHVGPASAPCGRAFGRPLRCGCRGRCHGWCRRIPAHRAFDVIDADRAARAGADEVREADRELGRPAPCARRRGHVAGARRSRRTSHGRLVRAVRLGGDLDVVARDAAVATGAAHLVQVDVQLVRQMPDDGRHRDVVAGHGRRRRRSRFCRGRRRLRGLRARGSGTGSDEGERCPHGDGRAGLDQQRLDLAVLEGLDVDGALHGVDHGDHLAVVDDVARADQPLDESALGHVGAERRHAELTHHGHPPRGRRRGPSRRWAGRRPPGASRTGWGPRASRRGRPGRRGRRSSPR